jgi:hypothetical protein
VHRDHKTGLAGKTVSPVLLKTYKTGRFLI